MVGNGVTNWEFDTTPAYVEMGYWHGLYDTELYNAFKDNKCNFAYAGFSNANISDACNGLMD
jgi:hypothetical protein